jgi:uncharacterized phiE125 gp8 family phage protein
VALELNTAPDALFNAAEAKNFLNISDGVDDSNDAIIEAFIHAATAWVENASGRKLMQQTWTLWLDEFPADLVIRLPFAPVSSVTHVKYTDQNGTVQTLSGPNYVTDLKSEPARLSPAYGLVWPTPRYSVPNTVEVKFVAGYGTTSASVPGALLTAAKMMVSHLYDNRGLVQIGGAVSNVPHSIEDLINEHKFFAVY